MVKIELTFNTQAEAVAFLMGRTEAPTSATAPAPAPSATITPAKQEAARASTAAGKAQAKADTKETPPADDGKAQEEAAAKAAAEKLAALRAEASAAIVKLAGANQPAAIELLASFNCKRAKELADDQLADALAKATAALKAAPADLS